MGLFYTTFYVGMMFGPAVGGRYAAWQGTASAALDFGALALVLCPVFLWIFYQLPKARVGEAA
jgi:hypothetical protein